MDHSVAVTLEFAVQQHLCFVNGQYSLLLHFGTAVSNDVIAIFKAPCKLPDEDTLVELNVQIMHLDHRERNATLPTTYSVLRSLSRLESEYTGLHLRNTYLGRRGMAFNNLAAGDMIDCQTDGRK